MRFVYHLRLIGMLLALCACAGRTGRPVTGFPKKKADVHLYLLIGQSNMAGRGVIEAEDTLTHPRVWMLNQAGRWVPAKAPLHFDKPALVGVGPGLAFGKKMADAAPGAVIGLVPCAVGGSPVAAWQPGAFYEPTKSHPYDDALRRARAAARNGTWKGILWHQGESDSRPESIGAYPAGLDALIDRLRQDLHAPGVPFVAGELGYFVIPKNPVVAQFNQQIRQLPARVRRTALVTAEGLTHKGDTLHFDAASARELGRRYAEQMKLLQQ